jgi:hypothetical protein
LRILKLRRSLPPNLFHYHNRPRANGTQASRAVVFSVVESLLQAKEEIVHY